MGPFFTVLVLCVALASSVCLRQLAGSDKDLGCTANDVRLTLFSKLSGTRICVAGDPVTVELRASLVCGASTRYDVGIVIAQDGGNAQTGTCFNAMLEPVSRTNADLNVLGGHGPYFNGEFGDRNDICGDIQAGATNFRDLAPIQIVCKDGDGNGLADLTSCSTWDNRESDGSKQKPSCTSILGTAPSTQSKCRCSTVTIPTLLVSATGNLPFPLCNDNGYSLVSGGLSARPSPPPTPTFPASLPLARFQMCAAAHFSCYSSCGPQKLACDDIFVGCIEGACSTTACKEASVPLLIPFMHQSQWIAAVSSCMCLGPGGDILPSTAPPSGLESWPLYDPVVAAPGAPSLSDVDLYDFASINLLSEAGSTFRTVQRPRADIVSVSSASEVVESLYFEGAESSPFAGMIAAKGPVVNEHTVSTCARYLGGQLLSIQKASISDFNVYLALVRQEKGKAPVFATSIAVALYKDRGFAMPVWAPSATHVDKEGLIGVLSFQMWATLPRVHMLHVMLIRMMELLERPSAWAITLDTSALRLSTLATPPIWFAAIRHNFPSGVSLAVASHGAARKRTEPLQVRVRCWKEPAASSWSEFNVTVNPEADSTGQLLSLRPLPNASSTAMESVATTTAFSLALPQCIDLSVWVTSGSFEDQTFMSQGFFFPIGAAKWSGGVSGMPVYKGSELLLPGSVRVTRNSEFGSAVGEEGVGRGLTANGCVDLALYSHLHFVLDTCNAKSGELQFALRHASGAVSTASVSVSESGCWSLASLDLQTLTPEQKERGSVCSIALIAPNEACFSFGSIILARDGTTISFENNFTVPSTGPRLCTHRALVSYTSRSSSSVSAAGWVGIALTLVVLVVVGVFVAFFVIRKRQHKVQRRKTSLLANQASPPVNGEDAKEQAEANLEALM